MTSSFYFFSALRENQQDFNNLPAKIKHFVGRESEIKEATRNFGDNSQKKFILIYGGPCYGKTTLAMNLGHIMVDEGLNFVIWISMRDISTQDRCPSMDKLAEKILHEFEIDTSEMRDDIQYYLYKKLSMISSNGKKAVLIFDNADSLISENDVFAHLKLLLANKKLKGDIKAIFTARTKITTGDDDFHKIELSCLSPDECKHYLDLSLKSDTLVERETLINKIAGLSHGLPLALKILASEMNESEDKECLLDYLRDVEQDPAQTVNENEEVQMFRLFEASFTNMDTGQLNLMKLLAVFPSSFSYEYMDKLSKCVKFKARFIQKLRKKGLVERQEPCYLIHPYLCEFVRQKKWLSGDKELYERAYEEVFLTSLFELGKRSLEKDAYPESRSEFVNERHNFLHLMASIREKISQKRGGTESLSFLKGILDRQTSEYVSVMIFVLGLLHPATLIDFYEDCERLVAREMKPNIWSIRNEVKMKCYDEELPKPEGYVIDDDCASVLIDSRVIHDKVWLVGKSSKTVDENKENALLEEVETLEKRANNLKCPKMKAYYGRKVCKDTAIFFKRKKKYGKAKKAYESALEICENAFGISWQTFDCYQQIAKFYFARKETENALLNFDKAEKVAEEMGVKNDKKFNAHLLNKGRFLVSTGTPENITEGIRLLENTLEFPYHDSDSNYWAEAVDCLATVDSMYYSKVIPYFCTLERPRIQLLILVRTKFEFEIKQPESNFDDEMILQKGLTAVNDLRKAVDHVTLILGHDKVEKSRLQLQEFRSLWWKLLALRTDHVLLLSERAEFAQHALAVWEMDDADDVKRERHRLEEIIKESKNIDPVREELIRRQHCLFKMKRPMQKAGRSEELKDKYMKLLQDTEGYQVLWTRFIKPFLKEDSSYYELVLPYLQSQAILTVPLLKLVTDVFTNRIESVKFQTDESEINQVSSQAINDLKLAMKYVASVEQGMNDSDESDNNNNLPFNLFLWNKLLATRTDHCLTNSERRPFATEALRIAATKTSIKVDDNAKKSLRFLKNWLSKDSKFERLQMKKQYLIANTKALQSADMQGHLELSYQGFLMESRDYPNLQLQLIKYILERKIVLPERYPAYLGTLVELVTEQRLVSGWHLQVVIDHLPTTLQHDNSLQCQKEGLYLCQRLNDFLKVARMECNSYLQKKFGFQLLKMMSVDANNNLLGVHLRRRYANAALKLDNKFHFTAEEADVAEYRQQIESILTNV